MSPFPQARRDDCHITPHHCPLSNAYAEMGIPALEWGGCGEAGGWDCNWRDLAFRKRMDPPSWVICDHIRSGPAKGLAFPSMADPGGFNLVVYLDRIDGADRLDVHDPTGALPKTQDSWPQA